ncbi:Crp/Fnr family transcriptional regulator [Sphingopyxis terrae]|nr:Crp/Fnr family transcriptional regulator [Sphingopyxis terrae]
MLSDGSRQIVSVHVPGEFVNLDLLIDAKAPHELRMLTPGRIVSVNAGAFGDCLRSRPAVLRALWRQTAVEASIFSEWIARLGRRDARARVAHFLCEFALRARLVAGKDIALPMTQMQLADATGLSPVHVNRTLAGLRRSGLIRVDVGDIRIRDLAGLAQAGDFDPSYLGLAGCEDELAARASAQN